MLVTISTSVSDRIRIIIMLYAGWCVLLLVHTLIVKIIARYYLWLNALIPPAYHPYKLLQVTSAHSFILTTVITLERMCCRRCYVVMLYDFRSC